MKKVEHKKRFSVSLSEKEGEMLRRYAAEHGITRPMAIRRLLKEQLKDYKVGASSPANQLGLFDTVQIDIFNNTSKVEE